MEDPTLVSNIGKGEMCRETIQSAEKFMCKVYNVSDVDSCDKARVVLFAKCKSPEALPPTSDALNFHVQRAHYQTLVWRQAHCVDPILTPAEDMGWDLVDGCLVPKLPAISDSCVEIVTCGCAKGCISARCRCRSSKLHCTVSCKCRGDLTFCRNS